MIFVEMNQSTKGELHEDLVEHHPWDREETSMIIPSRFQSMVWEVADLEAQFGGRDLTSKLSIGGLLCISEEEFKYLQVIGIGDGRGLQGQDTLGLLD